MRTRKQCEELVKKDRKFLGEEPWVPYLVDLWTMGEGAENVTNVVEFPVTEEIVGMFPELKFVKVVGFTLAGTVVKGWMRVGTDERGPAVLVTIPVKPP